MTRAWIFQANPDRYDIDAALGELGTMRWRVPQYTSEILPGDAVVLWRSGDDAGVVGVGRVTEPPQEVAPEPVEDRFDRGDAGEVTTRATVDVVACGFISKNQVMELPVLSRHQIVTAPMGTVFPLSDEQWEVLRQLLPEPPATETSRETGWPAAFSWGQRTKSVTPLPGGIEAYQEVLAEILEQVEQTQPARDELGEWVAQHFDVSGRRGTLVVGFLGRAGLLRIESARVQLTPGATRWLRDRSAVFMLALVHGRVRYVGEMLAFLDEPRTTEEILRHANEEFGMNWTSRGQIVRRRHLLGGLGAVEFDDEGRLARTALGEEALARLAVAWPRLAADHEPEQPPIPAPERRRGPVLTPATGADDAEEVAARLLETAHDSANPDAFEQAARDAFAFLGFDAVWHGGAGRTDVLLTAALGPRQRYRVVVDTKTTTREAVSDGQIDWVTIDDHQAHYDADHAAVVAPAFRGARLAERARTDRSVALLDVAALTDVVRQHAIAPLDLHAYRALFIPDQGTDAVIEAADVFRRQLVLAAEILRQIAGLEVDEDAVTPGDLYWNLDAFAEQFEGQRAERQEIRQVCDALARPPFSLLRQVDDGYASLGSSATTVRRLRLLAELMETGTPETRE